MKPAKIWQLTPKSYRPAIDLSERGIVGGQLIPMAQPAWLCGGDCVVVGDVDEKGELENNNSPVIATRFCGNLASRACSNVVATTTAATTSPTKATTTAITTSPTTATSSNTQQVEIQGTTTAISNSPGKIKPLNRDDGCQKSQDTTVAQRTNYLSEFADAYKQTTDTNFNKNSESCNFFTVSGNIEDPLQTLTTSQVLKNSSGKKQNSNSDIENEEIDKFDSYCKSLIDFSLLSNKFYAANSKSGDVQNYRSGTTFTEKRNPNDNFGVEIFERGKLIQEGGGTSSGLQVDMSITGNSQAVVYANYLNATKSISSFDEQENQNFAPSLSRQEQILAVDPGEFNKNRLSHQYLNSSVTGQNYPDILPETGQKFPFYFSDSKIVKQHFDFSNHSNMIFTATPTKETSFIEKACSPQQFPLTPSFPQYYNNKGTFSAPILRDAPNETTNRRVDDKVFKTSFPNGSGHDSRRENDVDLMFFPQLSHINCPIHRSSTPLSSPHLPLLQQPQQHLNSHCEQQQQQNFQHCCDQHQFVSQFHPNCRSSNWQQQQHQQQQQQYVHHQHHQHNHSAVSSALSLIQQIKCGPHSIRFSPVSLLWTFLSVLVAGSCLLSFLTPYWTKHPDHVHSFGLFNLCVRDQRYSHPRSLCINFGHQHYYSNSRSGATFGTLNNATVTAQIETSGIDIARIPSGAWQAACLLFGGGVCVQILGAVVSLVVLALSDPWHHRVALINGYMQTVGVLLLVSGVLLYPVGFSSPFFSYYCDSSKAFCTGHCAMGWSYVTAVMSTALSIFCPVMSSFAESQQVVKKPVITVGSTGE